MSLIRMWGNKHAVAAAALAELESLLGVEGRAALSDPSTSGEPGSESRQQGLVRLEAAKKDVLLFRNNIGVMESSDGRFIRFGLANDSERMNAALKSSDLIGLRRKVITPQMVGSVVGIFTARECKHEGWQYKPSDKRAAAQKTFIDLVNSYGGDACFAAGPGTL